MLLLGCDLAECHARCGGTGHRCPAVVEVTGGSYWSFVPSWEYNSHMLKAVMFDFGHTIMDELKGMEVPLTSRPVCLMSGLPDILPHITFKMGIWANTKVAREHDIWLWLRRARIDDYFEWVITSVDAGARKPGRRFFSYALKKCELKKDDVIFVGNQLNTDIRGANDYGIECVWLSGRAYHSPDDRPNDALILGQARPTHTIKSLKQLPALLKDLV